MPLTYVILPLSINCQCINFPEWISLFTLCLAPLIAHIIAGAPTVSYLAATRPRWYELICHYNPTSIIWRYAAVTDRRLRAKHWGRDDLAASNAIFWTVNGWDGSQEMVSAAAPYCLRRPQLTHVRIFSVTMLKTIITTLQGAAAIYTLIGLVAGRTDLNFASAMGVDMIFYPLSVIGLLRLCAAPWLDDDFEYNSITAGPAVSVGFPKMDHVTQATAQAPDSRDVMDPFLMTEDIPASTFQPPRSSWPSRIFRCFFLLLLAGIWGLTSQYILPTPTTPHSSTMYFTTTSFLVAFFYLLFLTVSILLFAVYFWRGRTTSTLIPCISSVWYKVWSCLILGFMLALIVISSIETSRAPDGIYTSAPWAVDLTCSHQNTWFSLGPTYALSTFGSLWDPKTFAAQLDAQLPGQYGLNESSTQMTGVIRNGTLSDDRYWLYNFTGYCQGRLDGLIY